jgi:hypothetical protein
MSDEHLQATGREARLAAFFAAEEPPARDPAFEAGLLARMERRRLFDLISDYLTPVVAALAVAFALWPAIARMSLAAIDASGYAAPVALSFAIVAATYWAAVRLRLMPPIMGVAV